jgi:hypothetical protein
VLLDEVRQGGIFALDAQIAKRFFEALVDLGFQCAQRWVQLRKGILRVYTTDSLFGQLQVNFPSLNSAGFLIAHNFMRPLPGTRGSDLATSQLPQAQACRKPMEACVGSLWRMPD